jgi:hypothetical protein
MIKKIIFVLVVVFGINLCFGAKSPDWVNGKSKKYPLELYITGVGASSDVNTSYDRAMAQIANVFSSEISVKSFVAAEEISGEKLYTDVAEDIKTSSNKKIEGIEIAGRWHDKENNLFYSLAVLNRRKAANILVKKISEIDAKISGIGLEFEKNPEKFKRAGFAMQILGLYEQKKLLNLDLQIISTAKKDVFNMRAAQKFKFIKAVSDIKTAVKVFGENSAVVEAAVIKALHSVGFTGEAAKNDGEISSYDMLAAASVIFKKRSYPYRQPGWQWSQGTVTVNVKNLKTGTVFLSFTVSDRQASADFQKAYQR